MAMIKLNLYVKKKNSQRFSGSVYTLMTIFRGYFSALESAKHFTDNHMY